MNTRDHFEQIMINIKVPEDRRIKFLSNYDFLQSKKGELTGKWAAALDRKIYEAEKLEDLQSRIKDLPEAEFAYTEQLRP